ncbi:MAG: class I SAM-dependent methyltransferase [Pseudomonadota bacterium]
MTELYDTIGVNYANLRQADPRIAAQIDDALGTAKRVVNVGAGAGSYEPAGREVTALEPSAQMIAQRSPTAAAAVQGSAEALPFDDNTFDAAMALLTIHHWPDKPRGVGQMCRVATDRVLFLTYDPEFRGLWQMDYFPQLTELDDGNMPSMSEFAGWLGDAVEICDVHVPWDCSDGFLYAFWRRPAAYLDARIRAGISAFWAIDGVDDGVACLQADLASGAWEARYGDDLLSRETLDCGYRLVAAQL